MPILPAKRGKKRYHSCMSTERPTPIYLDHNATTPVFPEVADAIRASWAEPGLNPSSQHAFGHCARRALDEAHDRIAELLGAKPTLPAPDRVIFTSGGTEANNLAILGTLQISAARPAHPSRNHLIISAIEHPSITALAEELEHGGWQVDRLGVDRDGVIRVDELRRMLRPETRLVAAMLANNETGVIQPVAELAAICAEHGVPLHTDAAQAGGKMPLSFRALGASTMAIAPHKFGGPVGIGALVVRHDVDLTPQLIGGRQQSGFRAGTIPVTLAVGMRRALELWDEHRRGWLDHLKKLRDEFESALRRGIQSARLVFFGEAADRLPNTSNVAFVGLDRQALFMAFDQAGVACSAGSACASGSSEPSPVLESMGFDPGVISSALRFSLGVFTTRAEVDEAAQRIIRICNDLGRQKLH